MSEETIRSVMSDIPEDRWYKAFPKVEKEVKQISNGEKEHTREERKDTP